MYPMAELLQALGLPLAFGGFAFRGRPALQQILPGHFLGDHLEAALDQIESLLASPRSAPASRPIAVEISALLPAFRQRRPSIDAQLRREFAPTALPPEQLDTALTYLGQAIADGLALGDLSLVAAEVAWVDGFLAHARIPAQHLTSFLTAYQRALAENLGAQGSPIADSLAGLIPPGSGD
jgi:hypothetical protein